MAPPDKEDKGKGKKISLHTFRKWNVEDIFNFQKETIDGATYVVKIVCKLCTKHVLAIERSDQMKGVARTQIRTYVNVRDQAQC